MKKLLQICLLGSMVLLAGCARKNIPLEQAFWQDKTQKVTVVAFQPPKPSVHTIGVDGLIPMAVAAAANNQLNHSVQASNLAWYSEMQKCFSDRLKASKMLASVYPKNVRNRQKDVKSILAETGSDLLLTLELIAVGARREYVSVIPKGGPTGYCVLVGELINPATKQVLWRHETEVIEPVQGAWDQPPNFPNFNQALAIAINDAKQEVMDSFFSGR